jgi:hypothetical protein
MERGDGLSGRLHGVDVSVTWQSRRVLGVDVSLTCQPRRVLGVDVSVTCLSETAAELAVTAA